MAPQDDTPAQFVDNAKAAVCEHYWISHHGGGPIWVETCSICRAVNWEALRKDFRVAADKMAAERIREVYGEIKYEDESVGVQPGMVNIRQVHYLFTERYREGLDGYAAPEEGGGAWPIVNHGITQHGWWCCQDESFKAKAAERMRASRNGKKQDCGGPSGGCLECSVDAARLHTGDRDA